MLHMGWAKFRSDLDELAEAKRERAAAKEAERVRESYTSFGERCQWLVAVEANPNANLTGRSTALVPRHDGFAKEVLRMPGVANELFARLREADSSTASDVLAEFGLPVSQPPSPARLIKIQHAVKVLAERSEHLLNAWIFDPADREWEASLVAEAAERLLLETRGE